MKKQLFFGTLLTGITSAAAFRYFSGLIVKRNGYKVPKFITPHTDCLVGNNSLTEKIQDYYEETKKIPFTEKAIRSNDNLRLKAKYYEVSSPQRIILILHGWRSSSDYDFAPILPELLKHNCTVIAPYLRAHGNSEGEIITFGAKEKADCLLWLNKIADEYPNLPLYLWGISMGATTAMLAAGEEHLPIQLKGIISDCGYDNAITELRYVLRKSLPKGDAQIIELFRRYFIRHYDFDLAEINTQAALEKATLPILFFHGTGDKLVPKETSLRNFAAANEPKELVLIKNADHTKSFYLEWEKCFNTVWNFFEKYH